jgi:hypothetical protein
MPKLIYNFSEYKEIKGDNFNILLDAITNSSGKKVNQILLSDFILEEPNGYELNHGIYIFKKGTENIYIGKASSRPFIERVPAHLDIRRNGWMNNMLKYLSKDSDPKNYLKESLDVIENYELLLVLFKTEDCTTDKISEAERFLIDNTNCLNKKRRKK